MTAHTVSPIPAQAGLPGSPGALYDPYRRGYNAGLQRGLAESRVDAELLDAYQRELATVYAELANERSRSTNLRHVLRSRS